MVKKNFRICTRCKIERHTKNKDEIYICEPCLRGPIRDIALKSRKHSKWLVGVLLFTHAVLFAFGFAVSYYFF